MIQLRYSFCLLISLASICLCPGAFASQYLAPNAVRSFYDQSTDELIWSDANYDALLIAIARLNEHGLNPVHYHLPELQLLTSNKKERDRLATDVWFSAAAHMVYGKLDPVSIEPDWTAARREADFARLLRGALASGTIAESLEALAPKQTGYQSLKAELAALRAEAQNDLTPVPPGPALRKDDHGSRVSALIQRLVELNLLEEAKEADAFNDVVDAAVKVFQADNDLDDDGIVGPATLHALNRGPQDKIDQVRVNMERWRWLPDDLGRRHIRANIAGFSLTVWENNAPVRTHLTIVGKSYRKTPVFSSTVQYVVFNPWWETPPSIARRDKLPAFRKDPNSVTQLGFQVLDRGGQPVDPNGIDWNSVSAANFPYRLRQAPGPQNALGQVKIMFPNGHNVYIHDTPSKGLFAQRQRAFSSGCLRTQDPLDLAAWLLNDVSEWNKKKIEATVASGKETRANLSSRVPVHILYSTVIAELAGGIRYLDDIYDRDGAVLAGLKEKPA